MPRSLTYGYNAALAINELVADRYIGAEYDETKIKDAFSFTFSSDTYHIYFSRPHIGLDVTQPGRNCFMRFDALRIITSFREPPADRDFGYEEDWTVRTKIEFSLERDTATGNLIPNFTEVTQEDVAVYCLVPDSYENPSKASDVEAYLRPLIVSALSNGQLIGISIPCSAGLELLYSDAIEVVTRNDDSVEDKDSLILAYYEEDDDETQGEPTDITNFMVDGKTATFRLSRALFERIWNDIIGDFFMRFEMEVASETYTERNIRVSSPNASGEVTIEGLEERPDAQVAARITNTRSSSSVSFNTDEKGKFSVAINAEVGDTLEFYGEYISDSSSGTLIKIKRPTLELSDGCLRLSGWIWARTLGGIDVSYEGSVRLTIDPVTGRIEAGRVETMVDLPCIGDFIMFLISLFIGNFVSEIYDWLNKMMANKLRDELGGFDLGFIPGLDEPDRIVSFLEDIDIRSNGIIVSGQMDAGSILNFGQTNTDHVDLDESATFDLDLESATVSVSHAHMRREIGIPFEKIEPEELFDPDLSFPDQTIHFSSLEDLNHRVFAVDTGGHYAKVCINLDSEAGPVIRWVTYNPPIESQVEIVGELRNNGVWGGDGRWRWGGADLYEGEFTAECTRLHTDGPLKVEWTCEPQLGRYTDDITHHMYTFTSVDGNDLKRHLEINTTKFPDPVSACTFKITVTVSDIFGRTSTASRSFDTEQKYREMIIPSIKYVSKERGDPRDPSREWSRVDGEEVRSIDEEPVERERREKNLEAARDHLIEEATEIDSAIAEIDSELQTIRSQRARRTK